MANNPHQKLAALKAQVAALEAKLSRENQKLAVLPAKHGFKSMDAFIAALRAASGGKATPAASASSSGRKPRAKITPETKAKVKELVKADKTGSEIAQALNISLPSVQNIKKELGLVKARK